MFLQSFKTHSQMQGNENKVKKKKYFSGKDRVVTFWTKPDDYHNCHTRFRLTKKLIFHEAEKLLRT